MDELGWIVYIIHGSGKLSWRACKQPGVFLCEAALAYSFTDHIEWLVKCGVEAHIAPHVRARKVAHRSILTRRAALATRAAHSLSGLCARSGSILVHVATTSEIQVLQQRDSLSLGNQLVEPPFLKAMMRLLEML